MLSKLVVPLDGSVLGNHALPFATRLARAANGRLILVRAGLAHTTWILDEEVLTLLAETRRAAVELAAVADQVAAQGIAVETCVQYDDAARAICDTARDRQADLVVMSMIGASGAGRSVYGEVAERVLRRTEVPVLLVPTTCETAWPTNRVLRVLVPLDGSAAAEAALGPAAALAEALCGELLLVRALPAAPTSAEASAAAGYLDALATLAGRTTPALPVSARVLPHAALAASFREQDADVLALTSRARGHTQRLIGATASEMVRRAGVPVLLVGPAVGPRGALSPEISAVPVDLLTAGDGSAITTRRRAEGTPRG